MMTGCGIRSGSLSIASSRTRPLRVGGMSRLAAWWRAWPRMSRTSLPSASGDPTHCPATFDTRCWTCRWQMWYADWLIGGSVEASIVNSGFVLIAVGGFRKHWRQSIWTSDGPAALVRCWSHTRRVRGSARLRQTVRVLCQSCWMRTRFLVLNARDGCVSPVQTARPPSAVVYWMKTSRSLARGRSQLLCRPAALVRMC